MKNVVDMPTAQEIEQALERAHAMRSEAVREMLVALWNVPSKLFTAKAKQKQA